MSDIALIWNEQRGGADFGVTQNDLTTDDGFTTAVELSLFTDRRAKAGDELPDPDDDDHRGWWGDNFPTVDGDEIGSRLWLLSRSKSEQDVLDRAVAYVREALQWMIDDHICDKIDVQSEIVGKSMMGLAIIIYRPKSDATGFRYNYMWTSQQFQRVG